MKHTKIITLGVAAATAVAGLLASPAASAAPAPAASARTTTASTHEPACSTAPANPMAMGPQYSAFHVYVQPGQLQAFATSWVNTFGGSYVKPFTTQLTPTPSSALATQVFSPVALLSVFDFTTGVPYPFGQERTGWGVANTDAATLQAQADGAASLVAAFPDPIGRDSVVQFPGGVDTQLWHETTLSPNPFPALTTVPDDRVYDYPFGDEVSGITVANLTATLAKATANGATVLWSLYAGHGGDSAMVRFPGGFVTEIHDGTLH